MENGENDPKIAYRIVPGECHLCRFPTEGRCESCGELLCALCKCDCETEKQKRLAADTTVWPTKPGDICPRCHQPKGEGSCHGEGGCDELVCLGWGDMCCRCGHNYALGQLP